MAEYIERETLIAEIQNNINTYWSEGLGGYYLAEDALNYSVKTAPTADVVPKSEVEWLEKEIKALLAFKDYFSDLYGHGLEVANWHENGELEYFDMFYESAVDEYEAELKKKYTESGDNK